MLTDQKANEIIAKQLDHANARRNDATLVRTDEPALRKAWLKKTFASFDYHEHMLAVHEYWLRLIKAALTRAEGAPTASQPSPWLRNTAVPNLEKCDKPGQLAREKWRPGKQAGWARDILDYDRDSGLDLPAMWDWLTEAESLRIFPLWGYMSQLATNIRRTADDTWNRTNDDILLDEQYTGPIDWPANWRDDVADLADGAAQRLRCEAGHPCPREGWWFTPAKAGSRRHFRQGEVMPAFSTDFGSTIWQWDERQGE